MALGDLGYESTLDTFKKNYGIFNLKCLVGNHDSAEDAGGDPIVKEAPAYCGDWWNVKVGSTTMLFGFNTNGDLNSQLEAAKENIIAGNQDSNCNDTQTMLYYSQFTPSSRTECESILRFPSIFNSGRNKGVLYCRT